MQSILITDFESGNLDNSGNEIENAEYIRSIMISVNSNSSITFMTYQLGNLCVYGILNNVYFYTKQKQFISSIVNINNGIYNHIPITAYYIRVVLKISSVSNLYSCFAYIDVPEYTLPLNYKTKAINKYKINESTSGGSYEYSCKLQTGTGSGYEYSYTTQNKIITNYDIGNYKNNYVQCNGYKVYYSSFTYDNYDSYTSASLTMTDDSVVNISFNYVYNENTQNYTCSMKINDKTYNLGNCAETKYGFYLTCSLVSRNSILTDDYFYLESVVLKVTYDNETVNKNYTIGNVKLSNADIKQNFEMQTVEEKKTILQETIASINE